MPRRSTSPEPWRAYAPEAFAAFDRVEALVDTAVPASILGPLRRAVAGALAHPEELERWPSPPAGDAHPRADACVLFAEQFVIDVGATTDEQRATLGRVLGDATFPFVQALYVVDVFQRARITLERLYGAESGPAPAPESGDLWAAIEHFMRVVALGSALDPLTTELVRLRGARAHRCRVCQSRLSVRALDQAGSRSPFDALDDYEHSDLSERHQVALRLADAVVTQPAFIDDDLVMQVREQLSDAEAVELVLDVTRNAANKIAVSLGGDAAVVDDGVEFFDVDASGDVFADVDPDAVRAATARPA